MSSSPNDAGAIQQILAKAREVAGDPGRFTVYRDDPLGFIRTVLGVTLWEKQEEVLIAARDHRRVAIRSGHGTGKSFVMACLILWWLYARQGRVVSTAPTKEHVQDVLWAEVNILFARARVPLPGKIWETDIKVNEELYATGITTNKPGAFQGRHHADLLVIIDEAPGVEDLIHEEISTLTTGARNTTVMVGNPTVTSGVFYEAFTADIGWHRIHISCFDHPNVVSGEEKIPGAVTREWIEEKRLAWGEDHPLWYSRVLGQFPRISIRGVIPLAWVERAQDDDRRQKELKEAEEKRIPRIGGLDVARYGDNKCVFYVRRGDAIETSFEWSHASLMETANRAVSLRQEWNLETLVVDASGIGAGVVDRLLELNEPVMAYNGQHRAFTLGAFTNRRSEMWWALRQRLENQRLWLPKHADTLVKDLLAPEYEINPAGRIKVETKEALLDRGVPSPDHADALVLCFAVDEDPLELPVAKPAANQDPAAFAAASAASKVAGQRQGPEQEDEFDQFPAGF